MAEDNPRAPGKGPRVVLFGAPGCGKGTQAELLAKHFSIPAIATGDMLREAVVAWTELGQRVKTVMDSGALVDDELMTEVVRERLAEPDAQGGFLLDGYPRTPPQAETLEEILAERSQTLDHVVLIQVPEQVLVSRILARGRDDDRVEIIRERLEMYRKKTEPLISYYKKRGLLREVDGNQGIGDVNAQILHILDSEEWSS